MVGWKEVAAPSTASTLGMLVVVLCIMCVEGRCVTDVVYCNVQSWRWWCVCAMFRGMVDGGDGKIQRMHGDVSGGEERI
jgi:hypothetical protein